MKRADAKRCDRQLRRFYASERTPPKICSLPRKDRFNRSTETVSPHAWEVKVIHDTWFEGEASNVTNARAAPTVGARIRQTP